MREIIFYKPDGTVKEKAALTEENLALCHGMKLKCRLKNGDEAIGFADVYRTYRQSEFDGKIHGCIGLWTLDSLDEVRHRLMGTDDPGDSQGCREVNIEDIIKIEAMLYSNPRWRTIHACAAKSSG